MEQNQLTAINWGTKIIINSVQKHWNFFTKAFYLVKNCDKRHDENVAFYLVFTKKLKSIKKSNWHAKTPRAYPN